MIVNFADIKEEEINNFYDGKDSVYSRMLVDNMNRIMHGRLKPGASIGMHKHNDGSEIVYILQGEGKAIYNNKEEFLKTGLCHYCPKGNSHSIVNDGDEDLVFFAVVPKQ